MGYIVTEKGIEVNPEKVRAIMKMAPPVGIKDIQILTGRMAGLGSFISRSVEKNFPFFKILRKGAQFEWTEEAQVAFDELKKLLANFPLLTKPIPDEPFVLYISVGIMAVSSALIR